MEKPAITMSFRYRRNVVIYGVIGAGLLVVAFVVSYSLNHYALSSLQFRASEAGGFDFATMSGDLFIEACNPSPVAASFDRYQMIAYYKDTDFATLAVQGGDVPPNQITVLRGNMDINGQAVTGIFMEELADAFSGRQTEGSEEDMTIKTILDAKVMGIFPYSQTRTFSMTEFQESMESSGDSDGFSCS
jgi:hypothetical protein